MKNILVGFLAFVVVGSGVSVSFADPYISGNLGAVILNDSDLDDGVDTGEFSYDTGFGFVAALGTSLQDDIRVEAELGYRKNDLDEIKVDGLGSGDIDGDVTTVSLMGNAYYDFSTESSFSPYIGAGLGYANIEGDLDDFGDEDDNVFAYQLILGGSFPSSETLSIDLQYRYFATEDPEFDGLDSEYSSHNILIGLRNSF